MNYDVCRFCGANDGLERNGSVIKCKYCGTTYNVEREQKVVEKLQEMLNELDQKEVASLRCQLHEQLKTYPPSAEAIVSLCRQIRNHIVDDFVASHYEHAYSGRMAEYAKFLTEVNVVENYPFVKTVVKHAIANLAEELILPVSSLIDRALNADVFSVAEYREIQTDFETEVQRVEDQVYNPRYPRDFFIMYSSKDRTKVDELVSQIESSGHTCFVAHRNIQHGRGSKDAYDEILRTAMDHCRCVVFVSSTNSRNYNCQAVSFEMDYIKSVDVNTAPPEMRNMNYTKIPYQYKKQRVEYLIERYNGANIFGEKVVKEFFSGLEFVNEDPFDVVGRYIKGWPPVGGKNPPPPPPVPGKNDEHKDSLIIEAKDCFENRDYSGAAECYADAADNGNSVGMCNLGYMYEIGLGVDRDVYKAAELYRSAADKGNARAMYNLGVCYKLGVGVRCDDAKAEELFKKAANSGDSYAKMKV